MSTLRMRSNNCHFFWANVALDALKGTLAAPTKSNSREIILLDVSLIEQKLRAYILYIYTC